MKNQLTKEQKHTVLQSFSLVTHLTSENLIYLLAGEEQLEKESKVCEDIKKKMADNLITSIHTLIGVLLMCGYTFEELEELITNKEGENK